MNIYTLIPLIATIIYIPLFVILLVNRPWNRRQKVFLLFLIPAFLWSFTAIFFRSDFLMPNKLLMAKIVVCVGIWMGVQYHYFLRSFLDPQRVKIPLAYALVISAVVLALLGYIPRNLDVTPGGIHLQYGIYFFLVLFPTIALASRDMYFLLRRHKISADPIERNQITYLFLGIVVLAVFGITTTTSWGSDYPTTHFGNFGNACVLTYAVMRHKLLDFRVLFRRVLVSTIYGILFISVCLAWWLLFQKVFHFESSFTHISIALLSTLAIFVGFGVQARSIIAERVDQVFYGERIWPRRKLFDFMTRTYDVPTLDQFGNQLVSLLSESIDCQSASLLLPQAEDGDFVGRFAHPSLENNPMAKLKLSHDSPVVTWLKREAKVLSARNISILPEFQGLSQDEREDLQSTKTEMLAPVINRGELVAILTIGSKRYGKLHTIEDIDLIESAMSHVAAGMEKEHSYERLQEQDQELALINRLTGIITSTVNIQDIFEGFAQELKKVVDLDYASIALIEEAQLHVLALSSQVRSVRRVGEKIPLKGSATEWVAEHRKSSYEANLQEHSRFWTAGHYIHEGIRSLLHLPLVVRDEVIGSLIIASCHPDAYRPEQIRLLEHLALQIATPIENSQLYARAEQRSRIDELTGLFNRRHFEERLKEEIARHSRHGDAFSLLMLDLDSFKAYNDMYGHPSGDRLLNQIGEIISGAIRNGDQAFRYGGDEFAAILPQTDAENAHTVAERVRECVAAEMDDRHLAVTCSIGLASYPSDGVLPGELVNTADTALYYAKSTGGNRTYLSSKMFSEPETEIETNTRAGTLSAVYALAAAVDAKDHYTYGHSRKVNAHSVALAEAIGLPPEEVARISTAALLHDIGKIGVPDRILNKKGKLTTEEWEAMKLHPRLGATIVGNIPDLAPCVGVILYHHERWDGTGYPEGLKGKAIPLGARILAVADAFAAMTSARPYRDALCEDKVLQRLRHGAGTQFDPELLGVFLGLIEAGPFNKAKVGLVPPDEQPTSQL